MKFKPQATNCDSMEEFDEIWKSLGSLRFQDRVENSSLAMLTNHPHNPTISTIQSAIASDPQYARVGQLLDVIARMLRDGNAAFALFGTVRAMSITGETLKKNLEDIAKHFKSKKSKVE